MKRIRQVASATVSIFILVLCIWGYRRGFTKSDAAQEGEAQGVEESHQEHHEESGSGHPSHAHGEHEHEEEGLVSLSEDQLKQAGIEIGIAKSGFIHKELVFPAEVKLDSDTVAHVYPRFAGVVRQVRKSIGDQVKKGETLAVIESNESLKNYDLKSLIDGTIIERHVTLGEMIREDSECFVVADLSRVWVDINVFPKDLSEIKVGYSASVHATHGAAEAEGKIAYIGPIVSEHTRTALARIILPNPLGIWRPGVFVTVNVAVNAASASLVVTQDALQTIDGSTVVFVRDEHGSFRAQPITVGRKSAREIEVLSGLKDGAEYVSKGSFILKAELGKSEAQHSHE